MLIGTPWKLERCRLRTSKKDAQLFRASFFEMSSRHRSNFHGVPISMNSPSMFYSSKARPISTTQCHCTAHCRQILWHRHDLTPAWLYWQVLQHLTGQVDRTAITATRPRHSWQACREIQGTSQDKRTQHTLECITNPMGRGEKRRTPTHSSFPLILQTLTPLMQALPGLHQQLHHPSQ